ncbi:nicotinamide N-methyltransferase-like [Pseudophryne corroboree]|uniref:nicotinamide N-methyltransferase-like n=1 Tax=Pseudophryne corroboree TaxID=495146 RepID=UPI0030815703
MDSSCKKLYHEHDFDSRTFLEMYFSDRPDMMYEDMAMKYPMEMLHNVFCTGHIKGGILIDFTAGPLIHHLYSACEFFSDIYVLRLNEQCVMELNRWLNTRTGAFPWDHTTAYVANMEGKSDQCEEKDMRLKTAIKEILKCNIENENIADPVVLPQADCVISVWLLELICKDKNDYISHLRKMTKLLKPGGHLLLIGAFNATYYMVGQERYHIYKNDENSAKQILREEGFIIDHYDEFKNNVVSDLTDSGGIMFIAAHKEK